MSIDNLTVNTLRVLSAEAVEKAKSGHPGLPLGAAPMAYTLWGKVMKANPENPNWVDRDRFILSAGHGSMLLYSLLHLFGYGVSMDDIKDFRQIDSKTPGHPEYGHTPGVEATTGPLGQGISNGVGMAMAEAHMAAKFNRDDYNIIDHYTYLIASDGDLMEGISYEATSIAGTLGLGKLIVLYDSNSITIEGGTDLAFTEDVKKRFEGLGWEVHEVEDGNDMDGILEKINLAKKNSNKPSLIKITTKIGYGSVKEGSEEAHGAPLGEENVEKLKEFLNWEEEKFTVPKEVKSNMETLKEKGKEQEENWKKMFREYEEKYPELASEFKSWVDLELPLDYLNSDEFWNFEKDMATRKASGVLLNRISKNMPNFIGGSADLAPSNKTTMDDRESFKKDDYSGSNLHFGVREHSMAGIVNGMNLHGGLRTFAATFFIFSDYMKPSMRLAALMGVPSIYVLTHDSIGVGEDGPTHQPIEQLAMLRAVPNFVTFRPADARETAAGWVTALTRIDAPTALILTRQSLPLLEGTGRDALKGGYILKKEEGDLDIVLLATGSEVQLVYKAAEELQKDGIGARVVSMPSWEIFEKQDAEYKESVIPRKIRKRLAVEAAAELGWHKYVGLDGEVISMTTFGASGPGDEVFKKFNFTVEHVVEKAKNLLNK